MTNEPLTATPSGERRCLCVKNHVPEPRELHRHHVWPLGEGGPDVVANLRWLCLPGDVPVTMSDGSPRRIDTMQIGDVVLGHDGQPHHVTGVKVSHAAENVVRLDDLLLTADHLVLTPAGWLPAGFLRKGDQVRRLQPASECVQSHVLSLVAAQPQIDRPVVVRDQVDVVHNFGTGKFTTDQRGDHEPRSRGHAALTVTPDCDDDMTLAVKPAFATVFHGPGNALQRSHAAWIAAKLRSTPFGPLVSRGEFTPAFQTGQHDRFSTPVRRRALGGAGGVSAGERVRAFEVFAADDAAFHSECDVSPAQGWWDALQHVERTSYVGSLYDITVAGSRSFVAGGIAVHNCPTSHSNVHQLWRIYDACGGQVGGAILRRYGKYVRDLVAEGWAQAHPEPVLF